MRCTVPETPDATNGSTADIATAPGSAQADTDEAQQDGDDSIKESFRAALARKSGQNSHVEQHLAGRRVGAGNNDTHKRQFRRKSG